MSYLITIPAYNEAEVIKNTILEVNRYIKIQFPGLIEQNKVRICVAINGTTDATAEIVKAAQKNIPYLSFTVTQEKGRGIALDRTWSSAPEDVFLYVDSDLAYSLHDIGSMISSYENEKGWHLAVASRRIAGSVVKRSTIRTFLTEGYNILIKALFFNKFSDAQAGCKSIRKDVYLSIRHKVHNYNGWFFDTALLIYAEKSGYMIKDLRITCIDNRKWRLSIFKTVLYFLKHLFFLRFKTLVTGY